MWGSLLLVSITGSCLQVRAGSAEDGARLFPTRCVRACEDAASTSARAAHHAGRSDRERQHSIWKPDGDSTSQELGQSSHLPGDSCVALYCIHLNEEEASVHEEVNSTGSEISSSGQIECTGDGG
jgi:hypothetical protein